MDNLKGVMKFFLIISLVALLILALNYFSIWIVLIALAIISHITILIQLAQIKSTLRELKEKERL